MIKAAGQFSNRENRLAAFSYLTDLFGYNHHTIA